MKLLLSAWRRRGLLGIAGLVVTLVALWLRHRPAVAAQERAVDAAKHRRLEAKRDLAQAKSSGTSAMIDESERRAASALLEYEAALSVLDRVTTEREAAEARLRALTSSAEPHERETENEP